MSKFNTPTRAKATGRGVVTTEAVASGKTFEGAPGYARDLKSEIFLLAVSNFVGEGSFYESTGDRDSRFERLSRDVAVLDLDWTTRFVRWLRTEANMRSAALVVALEGAYALNKAGVTGGRGLVAAALLRADEPGEALAYWFNKFGRAVPKAVKRGIADAAVNSYSEYALAKYDTASKGFRFGDVIDLVHPTPKASWQSDLFKFALDRRRDTKAEVPASLSKLTARNALLALSGDEIRALANSGELAGLLAEGGLTWEALSGAISGGMDAKAWEAVIPSMGYMALLRNLRNFEQAGVSDNVLNQVAAYLSDPEQVAKSRQLPLRFLSAYRATQDSLRFGFPLEKALEYSLSNVPALKGNTLILVDRSGSMFYSTARNSDLNYADSAALFGTALALRSEKATLVQYGSSSQEVKISRGDSVLALQKKFTDLGGTDTYGAVEKFYNGHDRVIILTDEQAYGGYYGSRRSVSDAVPANVPLWTVNLVGYQHAQAASGPNRYAIGGLSDATFGMFDLIERGRACDWPF